MWKFFLLGILDNPKCPPAAEVFFIDMRMIMICNATNKENHKSRQSWRKARIIGQICSEIYLSLNEAWVAKLWKI